MIATLPIDRGSRLVTWLHAVENTNQVGALRRGWGLSPPRHDSRSGLATALAPARSQQAWEEIE